MLAAQWYAILVQCQVKPMVATQWAQVFYDTVKPTTFSAGDADIKDFLGQVLHESAGLTRLEEDLNYSAQRLMQVWPARFPTVERAGKYAHSPEALANYVYGHRMGNLNYEDGWTYRGRSPIQITGKDNYARMGDLMGQNFVGIPDLLAQPHFALEATIAWWEHTIPDTMLGDQEKIRRRVNGSLLGLAETEHFAELAGKALA